MRTVSFFGLVICWLLICSFSTAQTATNGDNSPIVQTANSFHAIYGVRGDVINAILKAFEKEEPNAKKRIQLTENLIKQYSQVPERKQKSSVLSESSKVQLGIQNKPALAEALNWDLFATPRFLSSYGDNSPIINAGGDVNIWYGIPPEAVRLLSRRLEADKTALTDYEKRLESLTKKWEELNKSLLGREDEMAKEAKKLLEEGKIEEAVQVLKDRRYALRKITERSKKREAEAAFDYAIGLVLQMKYDSAAIQYKDAIELDPQKSTYLLYYSNNEMTRAHYKEAIIYYEKALGIDTLILGKSHPQIATYFNNLGMAWNEIGKYDRAIEFYLKSLHITILLLGEHHVNVAICLGNLGEALVSKGEYDQAIIYFEKALGIDTVAFGSSHPNVARDFNSLGRVWSYKGKYDRAIVYFEKALKIDIVAFGRNHPRIATCFNNLGLAWASKEEYDLAILYYEKALGIDTLIFGKSHPSVATCFNNLGLAWASKEEYDRALMFHKKSLYIDSIALGKSHPNLAHDYNNIGLTYASKGEYDSAINFYEKALDIASISLGNSHPKIAITNSNLGMAYKSKGEYDRAIVYFEKALRIDTIALGINHPNIATYFSNLGETWHAKAEYDRAIVCFGKALKVDTVVLGRNHLNIALHYNNIGLALKFKGEYDRAIIYYEKALVIVEQKLGANHPNTKACTRNTALAANAQGIEFLKTMKYSEALTYFQKALEKAERAEDFSISISCLNNIGSIYKYLEKFTEGLSTLEKGIALGEKLDTQLDKAEIRFSLLRMRYHQIGCLAGLGRKKEAELLVKQVLVEAEAVKDQIILNDLKRDGWIK